MGKICKHWKSLKKICEELVKENAQLKYELEMNKQGLSYEQRKFYETVFKKLPDKMGMFEL